jgi:hypothetical protein
MSNDPHPRMNRPVLVLGDSISASKGLYQWLANLNGNWGDTLSQ